LSAAAAAAAASFSDCCNHLVYLKASANSGANTQVVRYSLQLLHKPRGRGAPASLSKIASLAVLGSAMCTKTKQGHSRATRPIRNLKPVPGYQACPSSSPWLSASLYLAQSPAIGAATRCSGMPKLSIRVLRGSGPQEGGWAVAWRRKGEWMCADWHQQEYACHALDAATSAARRGSSNQAGAHNSKLHPPSKPASVSIQRVPVVGRQGAAEGAHGLWHRLAHSQGHQALGQEPGQVLHSRRSGRGRQGSQMGLGCAARSEK
jgi:hypothetical protein